MMLTLKIGLVLFSIWAVRFCFRKIDDARQVEREDMKRACRANSEPRGEWRRMRY